MGLVAVILKVIIALVIVAGVISIAVLVITYIGMAIGVLVEHMQKKAMTETPPANRSRLEHDN